MKYSQEPSISVKNVSKSFRLPHEKISSVKNVFTNFYRYIRKRRSFEQQTALKDISFDINQGEFFGIVGRNGSGKSTLLKMLAGIYQPDSGKINVQGKLVPFIELGVGFSPELTGKENVYLNGALLGFSKKEIDEQYDDIVGFAELEVHMDQKLKNYSSGMQVRLAFSMAVRAKADILLIDEVLAVGDADFQRKCFGYFNQLKGSSTTVILVSHDMNAIRQYCDRAMLIEKNEIIKIGNTVDVAREYGRLFMVNNLSDTEKPGEDQKRWGDGSIITSSLTCKQISGKIIISHQIIANETTGSPVIGFRLRGENGNDITGTNTRIEELKTPNLNKGDRYTVVWEFEDFLSDGKYYIDPSVLHSDGIGVCDWWDEAATLTVKKLKRVPYTAYPEIKVSLKKQ